MHISKRTKGGRRVRTAVRRPRSISVCGLAFATESPPECDARSGRRSRHGRSTRGSLGFFTRGPPSPHLGILWELPEDLKGRPGARRSRRPCAFCIGEERHSISVLFTPRYGLINRTVQALFRWGLERLSG